MFLSGPGVARWAVVLALGATPSLAADLVPEVKVVAAQPGEGLQVTSLGAGRPVVLIPGLFGAAYAFRKLTPKLAAAGYRTVVIEPLGVGDSARPENATYSLTAQADRVAATLAALDIADAVVIGHAVGASVALRLAYRHPKRVHAIVSIEGGPVETAVSPTFRRALKLAPLLRLFGGASLVRRKVRGQLKEVSADPAWVTDEVVDGYTRGAAKDLGATFKALQRMGQATEPEALSDHLAEIRCPVILVKGAASHASGPNAEEMELLKQRLKSFRVERAPGAGAYVFEEAPDAVVAAVASAWEPAPATETATATAATPRPAEDR
jgi:pimeloyl-ACP methyl ester carboxylesterase